MTRRPFPLKSDSKSKKILELIHTDLCESLQTIMPEKKCCILILIDDYSKYIIYLLDQKLEVTVRIKDFIQDVKMIKFLRYSDRTG